MNAAGTKPLPGIATLKAEFWTSRNAMAVELEPLIGNNRGTLLSGTGKAKVAEPERLCHMGLSGSGKSTVACALSQILYQRGKLSYIHDGDNVRHGLNRDLSFKAEDRADNIRRVGEVAKLFADSGVICIACLISPYRTDRDSCRAMLPTGDFIEVFMDVSLQVCEARDPKGLYKLALAGKIKGFTGIDDPYEPPTDCDVMFHHETEQKHFLIQYAFVVFLECWIPWLNGEANRGFFKT